MKSTLPLIALFALTQIGESAVTLTISGVTGATTGVLTNLASSTGDVTSRKVWGLLIDTNNDGIKAGDYLPGASLAGGGRGFLSTSNGVTDDLLVISTNLMVNTNNATLDGGTVAAGGLARPTNITSIAYSDGISLGDPFWVIWFDATDNSAGQVAAAGSYYGAFRVPAMTIPADGSNSSFANEFLGADPVRTANFTFVPETSTALLGALGVLGLLRRRR